MSDIEVEWVRKQLALTRAKLDVAFVDWTRNKRKWLPKSYKKKLVADLKVEERDLVALLAVVEQKRDLQLRQQSCEAQIRQLSAELQSINQQIQHTEKQARDIIMRKRGAVQRDKNSDVKSGLYSLFMMVVGLMVVIMGAVFLYLSPAFNKNSAQKTPTELNKPTEVIPLTPENETVQDDFKFYEILPERKFESTEPNLSEQKEVDNGGTLKVDKVVSAEESDHKPDEIEIVETNDTYDEPTESDQSEEVKISASGVSYFLQLQSYDDAGEADQRRAEAMMAGVDAQVVRRELEDGTVIYRVVSENYPNKDLAKYAYDQLKASGIDALVVEQKGKN